MADELLLALETSGTTGGAALLGRDQLIGSITFSSATLYSQRLLPSVEWLLQRTGRHISEVTAVAVSSGPGSFTGLRIGMSAAKAIAFANKASIIAVNTLEAMALRASGGCATEMICPVLDARQGEVYSALFRVRPCNPGDNSPAGMPILERLHEDFAGQIEEIASWITGPTIFAGDGALRYRDGLAAAAGENFIAAPLIRNLPSAEEVAWIAAERVARGEVDELASLEPHYLRKSYTQK